MLNQGDLQDFVIGTREIHSVREFLDEAFGYLNLDLHAYVKFNPNLFRKEESVLRADISKAERMLDWRPRLCFQELVGIREEYDLKLVIGGN